MIRIGTGELPMESAGATLRAALALSCATGASFRWEGFRRKRRPTPGFQPSDCEEVRLFSLLSAARLVGGGAGEDVLEFEPGTMAGGEHRFALSPDNSMCPLLRDAVLPLAFAARDSGAASSLRLTGSTHAPGGDTFEVTESSFGFFLRKLGIDVSFELAFAGFAPRGRGEAVVQVAPSNGKQMQALELTELDPLASIKIVSGGASLPTHVQQRQAARARSGVHISGFEPSVQLLKLRARSAGSVVAVTGWFGEIPITVASVSERGKSAEFVGEQAAASFRRYANQNAVVPGLLVSSLLPWLALASGETLLTTPNLPVTLAGEAVLVEAFTGRKISIQGKAGQRATVRIGN